MIKLQILVNIIPHKKNEFIQVISDICNSQPEQFSPLAVYQDLSDENLFYCEGEWDSRQSMEAYVRSTSYEILIGAMQVLGEIKHAKIYNIQSTEKLVLN